MPSVPRPRYVGRPLVDDAAVSEVAASSVCLARRRAGEHRLYRWAVVAAFAVVFVGFARTHYLKVLFGTPSLSPIVQLHGALMTGWFVLFFVQSSLIATHRVGLRRRVGALGAAWAALRVVVAATVPVRNAGRDAHHPLSLARRRSVPALPPVHPARVRHLRHRAVLLRRRIDWHKRLMLVSCIVMIGPGLTRIPLERMPFLAFLKSGGTAGLFSLDLLILYACVAWDTWHHRRLPPAFVLGAIPIVLANAPYIWRFVSSPSWTHLATWLVT